MPRQSSSPTFECETCHRDFRRYPSAIRKAEKRGSSIRFCSRACAAQGMMTGEYTYRSCQKCGKEFRLDPGWVRFQEKRGTRYGIYCSAKCRDGANKERMLSQSKSIISQCSTCGSPIRIILWKQRRGTKKNFCSKGCMDKMVHTWAGSSGIQGFRRDLGHRCRSTWEANVCRVFQAMGIEYWYEPFTFPLSIGHYTPDLWIPTWRFWIEVKGRITPLAGEKMYLFQVEYPDQHLLLLGQKEYRELSSEWRDRIPTWETR
jgi:hypothetical protein